MTKRLLGRSELACVIAAATSATIWMVLSAAASIRPHRILAASITPQQEPKKFLFAGVSSCAGNNCHGAPEAGSKKRSRQIEHNIWKQDDQHSRAFAVLEQDRSIRMARHLNLTNAPSKEDRCLNCHAINVPKDRQGTQFRLEDGVSCDGCHGPAEKWYFTHTQDTPDGAYEESIKVDKGMRDIRNPRVRAAMCLSCHLGNHAEGKIVDHEMLAAGHPPLVFELDTFSRRLPPHWREKPADEEAERRVRSWAAGQAVAVREEVRLLATDAGTESGRWPEYSHFDCAACHHDLNSNDWRQRRAKDTAATPPGRPEWLAGQTLEVLAVFAPDDALSNALERLNRELNAARVPFGRRGAVHDAAAAVEQALSDFVARVGERPLSRDHVREAAIKLCDSAPSVAWRGHAAARQLAFSLTSLVSAIGGEAEAAKSRLESFTQHDPAKYADEAAYDPKQFIDAVRAVRAALGP